MFNACDFIAFLSEGGHVTIKMANVSHVDIKDDLFARVVHIYPTRQRL
jgi:hypothetical protein